jgi:superfamily II DNA or RNA helicase
MQDILPGTEVVARGLRWEVVLTQQLGAQTLYRLRGLELAVAGDEIDLLTPFEKIDPVIHEIQPKKAAPLKNWLVYHQAFLLEQSLGMDALLAVQPGRLRIEPYQLVPVLRAIQMSRPRLLLCDDVGLGKTIQAGLIITEMVARRLAHRVLIVSPAGPLLDQWKLEMSDRFGLRLDVIDRARLEEIRKGTELGANPFDNISLGLVSVDFLKQERILDQLERSSYDIICIDEAHHCQDLGVAGDREDSQRRKLAKVLSRRCDALLLLTATPHDGYDRSFASLCELLDPSLVDGRGILRVQRYNHHVVRRLKKHIKDAKTGEPLFKEREVIPVSIKPDEQTHSNFINLHKALLALVAPQLKRAARQKQYSDFLSFFALLKRSVSTVAALQSTLRVVLERYQSILSEQAENQESTRQRQKSIRDYVRKIERFGTTTQEEEDERQLLEVEDMAQQLAMLYRDIRSGKRDLDRTTDIVNALKSMIEMADKAKTNDPKIIRVIELVEEIRNREPMTNILIYTEYTTSQKALSDALSKSFKAKVITMSSEDNDEDRKKITDKFRRSDGIILVSTDAAAEGLNLHHRCHHLIHLELPFNPNRLEQRNGRIDRYGQKLTPVVRYLYLLGTFEDRILLRLIMKYEKQRASLTFVPNTLGVSISSETYAQKLIDSLTQDESSIFTGLDISKSITGNENEGVDQATLDLLEEIDHSLQKFTRASKTNSWLGETGMNADTGLLQEADQAHAEGKRAGIADIVEFVRNAVLLDGGDVSETNEAGIFELKLPPPWRFGLDDLPGYDPEHHRMMLTTDMDITRDVEENSVGYLGRAHPLVRKALDRVRNITFGGMAKFSLDPRASAVKYKGKSPAILFTFLGRMTSRFGREFEQIIAVLVEEKLNTRFYQDSEEWLSLTDPSRAIRTDNLWEKKYQEWGQAAGEHAKCTAENEFEPVADEFLSEHITSMSKEKSDLMAWLESRCREVTSEFEFIPVQRELFGSSLNSASDYDVTGYESWMSLKTPEEKLAAFFADRSIPLAKRSEADGVLRLFKKRMEFLENRMALQEPEIIPLGLLMLVPEV